MFYEILGAVIRPFYFYQATRISEVIVNEGFHVGADFAFWQILF